MMWQEFEEIAGYEVSYETYSTIIEPMYMALPDGISKGQFVAMLNKKAFALPTKAELVKEMRQLARHLAEICGLYSDFKAEQKLESLMRQYAKRFFGLDLSNDLNSYGYFIPEYEYPGMRGCSFPAELVLGYKGHEMHRLVLVK